MQQAISSTLFGYVNTLERSQWNYVQTLAASGLVAVANLFSVYPIFYAGTRMANDVKTTSNLGRRQFNGIVDVYRKTLKSDGIAGLYRGYNISLAEICMKDAVSTVLKSWQQFWLLNLQVSGLDEILRTSSEVFSFMSLNCSFIPAHIVVSH